ncbi:unnamed protein product [Discosporangium mesarthrocarpum]
MGLGEGVEDPKVAAAAANGPGLGGRGVGVSGSSMQRFSLEEIPCVPSEDASMASSPHSLFSLSFFRGTTDSTPEIARPRDGADEAEAQGRAPASDTMAESAPMSPAKAVLSGSMIASSQEPAPESSVSGEQGARCSHAPALVPAPAVTVPTTSPTNNVPLRGSGDGGEGPGLNNNTLSLGSGLMLESSAYDCVRLEGPDRGGTGEGAGAVREGGKEGEKVQGEDQDQDHKQQQQQQQQQEVGDGSAVLGTRLSASEEQVTFWEGRARAAEEGQQRLEQAVFEQAAKLAQISDSLDGMLSLCKASPGTFQGPPFPITQLRGSPGPEANAAIPTPAAPHARKGPHQQVFWKDHHTQGEGGRGEGKKASSSRDVAVIALEEAVGSVAKVFNKASSALLISAGPSPGPGPGSPSGEELLVARRAGATERVQAKGADDKPPSGISAAAVREGGQDGKSGGSSATTTTTVTDSGSASAVAAMTAVVAAAEAAAAAATAAGAAAVEATGAAAAVARAGLGDGGNSVGSIAFTSFAPGQLALFFPTPGNKFLAFNCGCPRHFLSEESQTLVGEDYHFRDYYVLGRIVEIQNIVCEDPPSGPNANPYGVPQGAMIKLVSVASITAELEAEGVSTSW